MSWVGGNLKDIQVQLVNFNEKLGQTDPFAVCCFSFHI